jgi:hypothetical protein
LAAPSACIRSVYRCAPDKRMLFRIYSAFRVFHRVSSTVSTRPPVSTTRRATAARNAELPGHFVARRESRRPRLEPGTPSLRGAAPYGCRKPPIAAFLLTLWRRQPVYAAPLPHGRTPDGSDLPLPRDRAGTAPGTLSAPEAFGATGGSHPRAGKVSKFHNLGTFADGGGAAMVRATSSARRGCPSTDAGARRAPIVRPDARFSS